jgi:hypothetical protein
VIPSAAAVPVPIAVSIAAAVPIAIAIAVAVPVAIASTTATQAVLRGGRLDGSGPQERDGRRGERCATSLGQELATGGQFIGRLGNFHCGHDKNLCDSLRQVPRVAVQLTHGESVGICPPEYKKRSNTHPLS